MRQCIHMPTWSHHRGMIPLIALVGLATSDCGPTHVGDSAIRQKFIYPRDCKVTDEEAQRFTGSAVDDVWKSLTDPDERACWVAGIRTVGWIARDAQSVFDRLKGFVECKGMRPMDHIDLLAVREAFLSMGRLVARDVDPKKSKDIVDYLIKSSDAAGWEERDVRWCNVRPDQRGSIMRLLVRGAVDGLAISDHPIARERVLALAHEAAERRTYDVVTRAGDVDEVLVALPKLNPLPPGRFLYALNQMAKEDAAQSRESLRVLLGNAREVARRDYELSRSAAFLAENERSCDDWRSRCCAQDTLVSGTGKAEELAEERLRGLYGQLRSLRELIDDEDVISHLERVTGVLFPEDDPSRVVGMDARAQVLFVDDAVNQYRGEYAEDVDALTRYRIDEHIAEVARTNAQLQRRVAAGNEGTRSEGLCTYLPQEREPAQVSEDAEKRCQTSADESLDRCRDDSVDPNADESMREIAGRECDQQSKSVFEQCMKVANAEAEADGRLRALFWQLESLVALVEEEEVRRTAKALLDVMFPGGQQVVDHWKEKLQWKQVSAGLERYDTDYGSFVLRLARYRLGEHVQAVKAANNALKAAIDEAELDPIGRDQLGQVSAVSRRALGSAIVARVVSEFSGLPECRTELSMHRAERKRLRGLCPPGAEGARPRACHDVSEHERAISACEAEIVAERAARVRLLTPLVNQSAEIDRYLEDLRVVRDVDPTTGQALPALVGNHFDVEGAR